MQVMIKMYFFGIGDFIDCTTRLFEGFLETAGYKRESDDKKGNKDWYYLDKNRGLMDYVNKLKKGHLPKFTANNRECYLNRCRYYIYKEKRENNYKSRKNIEVDSPETFSRKTVELFFELSGINFSFLRLQQIDEKSSRLDIALRYAQELCLDGLFTDTVNYLSWYEERYNDKKPYSFQLVNLWKLLFRKYRYLLFPFLSKKAASIQEPFMNEEFFLNEELLQHVRFLTGAYYEVIERSKVYDEHFYEGQESLGRINYIVEEGEKEKIQRLKDGYKKELSRYEKLLDIIQKIAKAKEFKSIKRECQQYIPSDELKRFEDTTSKSITWKIKLIEMAIEYSDHLKMYSFLASVFYLRKFDEVTEAYRKLCETMWDFIGKATENMEVLNYLTEGKKETTDLIAELDVTLWILYYHNGEFEG